MFEELNRELVNAKEKLLRKKKFQSLVNQTRESLQKELDRKLALENILKDEDNDVKKLESLSIASIFYSILGSKHQQLEKERQELLSAKLKYDECCKSVLALEGELASYKSSLNSLLGTAAKHSHIDEAKEYVHNTKIALIRFQNELSDVNLIMNIDINISSFETFADYFFDGLISDWVVQSRICESLDSAKSVADHVARIIGSLKEKFNSIQNDLLSTEENIKLLVEQA